MQFIFLNLRDRFIELQWSFWWRYRNLFIDSCFPFLIGWVREVGSKSLHMQIWGSSSSKTKESFWSTIGFRVCKGHYPCWGTFWYYFVGLLWQLCMYFLWEVVELAWYFLDFHIGYSFLFFAIFGLSKLWKGLYLGVSLFVKRYSSNFLWLKTAEFWFISCRVANSP